MSVYRRDYGKERGVGRQEAVWAYAFSYRRLRCRRSGFRSRSEAALAEARARDQLVSKGIIPGTREEIRFSALCKKFLSRRDLTCSPQTVLSEKYKARQLEKRLGNLVVSSIQTRHITDYRDHRLREGVSHRSANLEIIFVRCLLNFAVEQGHAEHNPAKGIKLLREVRRDKPTPSDDQLQRLLAEAESTTVGRQLVVWLWLLALTGLRPSEAFHLEWRDIELDARRVFVRPKQAYSLKTGRFRVVEIHDMLLPILQEWRQTWDAVFAENKKGRTHDWIFFNPRRQNFRVATFAKAFEDARERAGLDGTGITTYSLRHYFISKAIMAGVDLFTIAKWAGHSSTHMIEQVYGHLTPEFRLLQMAKIRFPPPPPPHKQAGVEEVCMPANP